MTASKAAPAARAMILPLALAQFIASYAATNMNVAISAWFFLHVRSREKRGKDVLLPLRLFRNKIANLGLGTQTIQWLILQGSFFTVSL